MAFSFGSRGKSPLHRRSKKAKNRRNSISRTDSRRRFALEPLEERVLLNATMEFQHVIYDPSSGLGIPGALISTPFGSATPPTTAFTPAQIRKAYGIDQIFDKGAAADGTGMTIAILDAYDNPKFVSRSATLPLEQDTAYLASDLHKFCLQYGLPETAGFFTKVDQTGGTNYPSGDTGWGTEIALDVEWVHAIAPGAKIVLVEANSDYDSDLINVAAVWARDHSGAVAISMSFGRSESSSDTGLNSIFQSPADHGLTWLASTGDDSQPSGYPAFAPGVVAVGGTTLNAPNGVYASETGWSGSGGSVSYYQAQPKYQQGLVIHDGTSIISANGKRSNPDVSFDADPNSGVAVYDSYANSSSAPWIQVGGTSFSSPAWAGLVAIVNQIRANHGLASLDGPSGLLPKIYNSQFASDYHDITSGSNGYTAGVGYDLVTGIGTPKAEKLAFDLAGVNIPLKVIGTAPELSGGTLNVGSTSLTVNFNKTLLTGADNAGNYQLQSTGPDGLLGTADDVIVPVNVAYSGIFATLSFAALPEEAYRLIVRDTITDADGSKLDGDNDTNPGGDWRADFVVAVNPSLSFVPVSTSSTGGNNPLGITTGDFNNDGILDLVVTNNGSGTIGIRLGDGHGGFSTASTYTLGSNGPCFNIEAADFDGDGQLDLVVPNNSGSPTNSTSFGILLGNGKGSFWAPSSFGSGGNAPYDVAVADFNGDGKPDVAITNRNSGNIGVALGTGYGFSYPVTYSTGGSYPDEIAIGDFNADGKIDLTTVNFGSDTVSILLGAGNGTFGTASTFSTGGVGPTSIALSDFNADGKLDLAVTNASNDRVAVLLGNGNGGLGTAVTYSTNGIGLLSISAADFNGDGKFDLAVTDDISNNVGILLGDGKGGFAAAVTFNSGGTPTNFVPGDFNGDGLADLAIVNSDSANVGILLNNSYCSYATKYSPHLLPFDVSSGSFGAGELIQGSNNAFDGDGRLFVGGMPFQPNTQPFATLDGGRTLRTIGETIAGLDVCRKITVPNAGAEDFARTVDVFTNNTGSPITTTVRIVGNLGSDAKTAVFATSDGTGVLSPNDLWIGTDDNVDGGGTPAIIHYIHGPGALKPDSVNLTGDNIEWTYTITVPANQTVRLAYFTIVAANRSTAIAAANALVTPAGFGGQAASFLNTWELQSLANFINLNHAPLLTPASPSLPATDENTPITMNVASVFINNGGGTTTIADADSADPIGGIAITAVAGNGNWLYSLDGINFSPVGTVSNSASLLLPSSALLRYTPDLINGEMPTITYRAWDRSFGGQGTKVDTTVNGGVTAFSAASDTATLTVASLNDAPVLNAAAPNLGRTTTIAPVIFDLSTSFLNHGAGTTTITDADNGAILGGIALVGTAGSGVWSFSLDGMNFLPLGNVAGDSALLLPKTALLCFTPDSNWGIASISYRAWDATTGTAGTTADTTVNGGATAFSTATDTASILVNDAPVLTSAAPLMGTTDENTNITIDLASVFINHGSDTTTIADPNLGAALGGIALTGVAGRGVWSYSLDGSTFVSIGNLSDASALLLPSTAKLRYAPDQKNGEMPTITYRAWDTTSGTAGAQVDTTINGGSTAFSIATDTAMLTVNDVNDAPLLTNASPMLGYTKSKTPIVINIAGTLVNGGAGTTTITEVDNGAILGGIVLFAASGRGSWSYSLDGVNFMPVGTISSTAALLLPASAQLAYTPDGINSETVNLTYRAWDQTAGTPGSLANTSVNGGTSAFSSSSDSASMIVDYISPTLSSTSPGLSGGTMTMGTTTLVITFSETMVGLGTAANYQLQNAGTDGLLGTADDTLIAISATANSNTATLAFPAPLQNLYRLTVFDSLTDLAGNKFDGNSDGVGGGNWTADFVITPSTSSAFAAPLDLTTGGTNCYGVATGDFNLDGRLDLVVANSITSGIVSVLLNDGKGGFLPAATFSTGGNTPRDVAVADFNKDGKPDIAVANYGSGTVGIRLGDGNGGFSNVSTFSSGGWYTQAFAIRDFNGDGNPDIATTHWGDGTVGILLGNGNGSFTTSTVSSGGAWPDDIVSADFNHDGKFDLAVANGSSNTVGILLGNGTGGFTLSTSLSSNTSWTQGIAVGDFNGDGNADLATTGVSSSTIGIFLGNGSGGFTAAATVSAGSWLQGITVADLNGDGKADLIADGGSGAIVCLGNGNGTFASPSVYSTGGTGLTKVTAGDLNGDNTIDIAVSHNSSSGTVGILCNISGLTAVTLSSVHGFPFEISVGNFGAGEINQGYNNAFDGDGRMFVGGTAFTPSRSASTTADSGRTIVTASGTATGLTVSRKITVPNAGNEDFARTVDSFTNPTGSDITTTVRIVGNLGSDAKTMIFATSDGTGIASPNDLWIGTDDNLDGSGTPAVIHYIHGPGALKPDAVSLVGDNLQWSYTLTVPAGQTVELAYYTIVASTRTAAIAAANALVTPSGFGGEAATYLTSTELQSIKNFVNNNHAPVLSPASPSLGSTDEDTAITINVAGTFVNHGPNSTTVTDPDSGDLVGGIAVIGASGSGVWTYSLDGNAFTTFAASLNAALLLPATAQLRYTPNFLNGGTASISYFAWDQTYGTPGTQVNAQTNGGSTAFSMVSDTAALTVIELNEAPVLTAAQPSLGGTTKDIPFTVALAGTFINNGASTTKITDVDSGAIIGGIAVIGTTGYGSWSYSLDGTVFTAIGAVADNSGLLLPSTAKLQYVSDGIHGEQATISYRAWDASAGTAGTYADTSINGGSTAFSTVMDTASLVVNTPPVLTPAAPAIGSTDENTAFNTGIFQTFINNGPQSTIIVDSDPGAMVGGIALTGISGRGVWYYSLDGVAFTAVGSVSNTSALLLPSAAQLRYVPDGKNGEIATITYRAWDATSGSAGSKFDSTAAGILAFSSNSDTATLAVADMNDAPVLTPASPSLAKSSSKTDFIFSLSGLFINHGTGTTTITDVDNGAAVGGIALTGATGLGTWKYSLDSTNFIQVETVSSAAALLLPATAKLAYTPTGTTSESPTISYRAWDSTAGTAGGKVDVTSNGGITAFSLASDTATLTLDYLAPTIAGTTLQLAGGIVPLGTTSLTVQFSEAMANAGWMGLYTIQSPGPDDMLGTADDWISYPNINSNNATTVILYLPFTSEGIYRLTILDDLTDMVGNKLDGNGDGVPGGKYVEDFSIVNCNFLANVVVSSAGVSTPWKITKGDFNRDGKLDLAVTGSGSNRVGVLLGNGNGGFGTATTFSTGGSPHGIVAADFNGDGFLDLAVTNSSSNNVGILLGNGSGSFGTVSTFNSGGSSPQNVVAGDFNGDGILDLAVTNAGNSKVGILLGNGSGGFGAATTFSPGGRAFGIKTADFNGDGKLDLAVVNNDSNGTVGILLGDGNGSFSSPSLFSSGGVSPEDIALGDFNGDGKTDLAVHNNSDGTLEILLGNGNAGFTSLPAFPSGGYKPRSIAVDDLNGDGNLDLVVSNYSTSSVGVLLGLGNGKFLPYISSPSSNSSDYAAVVTGDFNGDGKIDLVNTVYSSYVGISLNNGAYGWTTLNSPQGMPFDVCMKGMAAGVLVQRSSSTFDYDGLLRIGGSYFQPSQPAYTTADAGQTLVSSTSTYSGLAVSRRITVPSTGGESFARTVDVFTNNTANPITRTVKITGNLGSDAATTLFATSSADTTLTPDDLWFGTDAGGTGTAVIHCFRSFYGLKPTTVSVVGDNVTWTFSLTVPAHQTRELGYFTIQAADRSQAIAEANALMNDNGFLDTAALGLNDGDLAALANFQFDHAPTDITLSNASVAENQAGAVIGSLATTDPDQGGSYTYALTNDPTGKFEIVGNTLKLKDGESFDFEAMADPTVMLTIRTTDNPGGLSFEKQIAITVVNIAEPMIVLPSDLPATGTANLTLSLESDGKLHVLRIDGASATDVVPPRAFSDVSQISITGRDGLAEILIIDFGGGNPVPAGGVNFDGGFSGEEGGNSLVLHGTPDADNVEMTASQITLNASAPIVYDNITDFAFALDVGVNSLQLKQAILDLAQDDAISAGTEVTVDGGMLNFNGHNDAIGNLTLLNGGRVIAPAIDNTTTTVTSGTLTVGSIVCDTLIIGGSPQNESPAQRSVSSQTREAVKPFVRIDSTPPSAATALESPVAIPTNPISSSKGPLEDLQSTVPAGLVQVANAFEDIPADIGKGESSRSALQDPYSVPLLRQDDPISLEKVAVHASSLLLQQVKEIQPVSWMNADRQASSQSLLTSNYTYAAPSFALHREAHSAAIKSIVSNKPKALPDSELEVLIARRIEVRKTNKFSPQAVDQMLSMSMIFEE